MNFRQTYYGKLGYRVEEKGKLEQLLDEKKVKDLTKLKIFAQEGYSQDYASRLHLWCYLSNLYPIHSPSNHKYVVTQRLEEFGDLKRAVLVLRLVDESAPLEQIFLMMWLLENQRLPFGNKISVPEQDDHPLVAISKALRQMFQPQMAEKPIEFQLYWLAKSLFSLTDLDSLVAHTYAELESFDPKLFRELEQRRIPQQLPISRWFQKCFAGTVVHTRLVIIWDKLFGGVPLILLGFLYIQMLRYLRDKLLVCDCDSFERTFDIFATDQEAADRIVKRAIEMLEVHNKK